MLPFIVSYEVKAIKIHLGIIEEIRLCTLQRERRRPSLTQLRSGRRRKSGGAERVHQKVKQSEQRPSVGEIAVKKVLSEKEKYRMIQTERDNRRVLLETNSVVNGRYENCRDWGGGTD